MMLPSPPRPSLVQIGRVSSHAQGWWHQIQAVAEVLAFPSLDVALEARLPQPPRVTILLQSREDEHRPKALAQWLNQYPLCRCLFLLGPWVSGRIPHAVRTGGCPSFAWHQTATLQHRLRDYLAGHSPSIDCPSASPAEQILSAWQARPAAPEPDLPPLWIASNHIEVCESLVQLLRSMGHVTFSPPMIPHANQTGTGIFHVSLDTDWTQHASWNYCQTRIALVDFPDPGLRRELRRAGYDDILPWPFHYPDLRIQLQRAREIRFHSPT